MAEIDHTEAKASDQGVEKIRGLAEEAIAELGLKSRVSEVAHDEKEGWTISFTDHDPFSHPLKGDSYPFSARLIKLSDQGSPLKRALKETFQTTDDHFAPRICDTFVLNLTWM